MTITTEVKEATKQRLLRDLPHVLGTGRDNAMRGADLAHRFDLKDDRLVRIAIRQLIAEGMPILSATDHPAGYFIASSQEEIGVCAQGLRDRLIDIAVRRRDILRASKAVRRPGQLPLI